MSAAHDTQALAACPFCGHAAAAKLIDSRDFQDMVDGEFDESNEVYFAVVCDASKPAGPGGCGGMGGFAPTQDKAIALWNARATLASRLQEQEGQPALARLTAEERAHVIGVLRRNHDEEFINRIRATLAAGSQAVHVPADKSQAARYEIGKWLNEGQLREINRQALAELCAGFDLLERAVQVPGWRPIASAPKDVPVLLLVPTRAAKWSEAISCTGQWMHGFWVIFNADEAIQRVTPTHWKASPAAPLQPLAGGEAG